jgi:hypothetical protein
MKLYSTISYKIIQLYNYTIIKLQNMKTRSQTYDLPIIDKIVDPIINPIPHPLYTVDIDFDEASYLWTSNKKKQSNGCYTYVCGSLLKNGKFCQRKSCGITQHNFV